MCDPNVMNSKIEEIKKDHIPEHVAIIMDGNGRWAQERGMDRTQGHRFGTSKLGELFRTAVQLGVKTLTLYTFSTENWSRPKDEVAAIMALLSDTIRNESEQLMTNGVQLRVMGALEGLPLEQRSALDSIVEQTKHNNRLEIVLALNYSGKSELLRAINLLIQENVSPNIDEELLRRYFFLPDLPDPDLLIRTGGEYRVSNFLLWQIAYTELYFTDLYWPDFDGMAFIDAVEDFQKRERRFGKTGEQIQKE